MHPIHRSGRRSFVQGSPCYGDGPSPLPPSLPLRTTRELLWTLATLETFVLAPLMGHLFSCVICGDSSDVTIMDANYKFSRNRTAGGDNVAWFLNSSTLRSPIDVSAALSLLRDFSSSSDAASHTCQGSTGASHWRAARKRVVQLLSHQRGLFARKVLHSWPHHLTRIMSTSPAVLLVVAGLSRGNQS